MNREGYIRLYRSLLDWEWYHDEACVRLFVHLLLNVNWKEKRWMGMDIPAGTVMTSLVQLSDVLRWDRAKTKRTLSKLKKSGEVTTKTSNHWTAITLTGWAKYQSCDQQSVQPVTQQKSNQGPTEVQPPTTTKESKETKKEKKERKEEARSVEDRKREFLDRCREAVTEAPERLPQPLRQGFADYWTELDAKGERMRFEDQKYFDVSRRMVTWKQRAIASGDIKDTAPKGNWNPRA